MERRKAGKQLVVPTETASSNVFQYIPYQSISSISAFFFVRLPHMGQHNLPALGSMLIKKNTDKLGLSTDR